MALVSFLMQLTLLSLTEQAMGRHHLRLEQLVNYSPLRFFRLPCDSIRSYASIHGRIHDWYDSLKDRSRLR